MQLSLKTWVGQRANQNFMNNNLSPWLNSVEPANDPRIRWKQTPKGLLPTSTDHTQFCRDVSSLQKLHAAGAREGKVEDAVLWKI
jgi:hypothetical protein